MKSRKSGCAAKGFDLNSGWNWEPTKKGWFGSSTISARLPSGEFPENTSPAVAFTVEHALVERGHMAYCLDGDNIRHGLNKNLGFSPEDRTENIRRIGEVAKLFADTGVLTMTSFISPYRADRDLVRTIHDEAGLPFIEVFVDTSLEVCEKRDPKGLYKKARAGEIPEFTGISAPYEAPEKPEIVLDSGVLSATDAAAKVIEYLDSRKLLTA